MPLLVDRYDRPVTNLRISVTQRCDLNCIYCHREGEVRGDGKELSTEQFNAIIRAAAQLGIKQFKFTGGEPLLRADLPSMVKTAVSEGAIDVAITTNGTLLWRRVHELHEAGLMRVNVSLPSTRRDVYKEITGKDMLDKVLKGVEEAAKRFRLVKLNMVVLKGVNDDELEEAMSIAKEYNAVLQLIELEPIGIDMDFYKTHHLDLSTIEKELKARASKIEVRRLMNNRRKYLVNGVEVEVVRPIENSEFCLHCTRLRVTSNGFLKPCLMRNDNLVKIDEEDFNSIEKLKQKIIQAVMLREPLYKEAINQRLKL